MKFQQFSHWSELPESVDVLFQTIASSNMFVTREWLETLWDIELKDENTLLITCVMEQGHVIALLPLMGENGRWQSIQHRYSSLTSLLVLDDKRTEAIQCLVNGLDALLMESLDLRPIDEADLNITILKQTLEAKGYKSHSKFLFYNWYHQTVGQTFESYINERPKMLLNTIKRKQRKLERECDYDIRMFRGDEVSEGLHDYHEVYSASWKATEQYRKFLDEATLSLSNKDCVRLAVLYINGEAAAAQLWFVVEAKANIFRLSYKETWKKYSPGSILTMFLMEQVIGVDNVEEIDFLTGNEKYKQDWMASRRERSSLVFSKPRDLPKAENLAQKIKQFFN